MHCRSILPLPSRYLISSSLLSCATPFLQAALLQLQGRDSEYMFASIDFLMATSNSSGFRDPSIQEPQVTKRLGHTLGQVKRERDLDI